MEMTTEIRADAASSPESVERMTIHSPRLSNNAYLLDLLNGCVWLLEQADNGKPRRRLIEVLLYPVRSPWVRWVRAFTDLSTVPAKVRRYLLRQLRPLEANFGSCVDRRGLAIMDRGRIQSSSVRIQLHETSIINIHRVEMSYAESLLPTIRACFRALRHWRACRQNGRLNVQALLLLRYRDVPVGDLVASETIGLNSSAGGSLRRCGFMALFGCLVDVIYTVDYILGRTWNAQGSAYVTTSETTYLEELYRRTLKLRGFSMLELYDYSGRLRVVGPDEEMPNPFIVRGRDGEALSAHQHDRTWRYLAGRVSDAGKHLWYMSVGQNSSEREHVVSEQGRAVVRDDQSLTVVIFLHSFDDAQYIFGLDGFEDLYEWTVVTINECLGNREIGRVLIKEHPNIDLATFPSDKHAVRRLRSCFQHEPKIEFIDRRTNIKTLTSLGLVYGITHHGSVAEELVAVGLPVIASSTAPWGKNYPFLRLWDSPSEYVAILRGLRTADWCAPGNGEREALAQYVHEYRLNIMPGQDTPVSVQWMVWKNSTVDILAPDFSSVTEQQIAELEADSPQLIEWLRDRAKGYRGRPETARANSGTRRAVQRSASR